MRRGLSRAKQPAQGKERIERAEMDATTKLWEELSTRERAELPAPEGSQELVASQTPNLELEGNNALYELDVNRNTHCEK